MKITKSFLSAAVCLALAGCAGLNARKREAAEASLKITAAEASLGSARQSGAPSCGSKEFKLAESDLKLAKTNLGKKDYGLALTLAKSADSNAAAAAKKCKEAKGKAKAK